MSLVPIEDQQAALAPRDVIAGAKEQADALMEIVQDRKLFATVGGKPYLEAEAWEIICAFNNVAPDVVYVNSILDDGKVVAYEAKVNLLDRNGALRGSGIAECSLESFPTRGREGRDKDKAAKSAAQTWAISKAARMAFSWVAVLAGFQPTPASEMVNAPADPQDENYCAEHETVWFKRGKMRNFAHPVNDGSGGWCNRPSQQPPDHPTEATEPVSEPQGSEQPAEEDGGAPLFPPEPDTMRDALDNKPRHFADIGQFRAALKDNFGLAATAEVNKALDEAGLGPLAELRNLDEAYANLAAHRGESTEG